MCGIAGLISYGDAPPLSRNEARESIQCMTSMLARRGPDDQGTYSDPDGRVYLGFRRLSILDLTICGHQPMISNSRRSVLVYNGELYNFLELRAELADEGIYVRSSGDSAVLLEALEFWGEAVLERLNGMFAFAWYDRHSRKLLLVRDHAGIKPLYVFEPPGGRGLAFASQYDCLLHTPWGEPGPVREDVLQLYLRLHHVPPPLGLLEHTWQVEPGEVVRLDVEKGRYQRRYWWRLPESAPHADITDPDEASERVHHTLQRALRRLRVADVPVGVFLSGGVDSPLVSAIARMQHGPGLRAFTLGSPGWTQDESAEARQFAQALDLDHLMREHHNNNDAATLCAALEEVAAAMHEPFADFSLLPTLWVSRLAADHVAVALSGDGGDELFFGYERPASLLRAAATHRLPHPLRKLRYAAGRLGLMSRISDTVMHAHPGAYYFAVNSRTSEADLAELAPALAARGKEPPAAFALYAKPPRASLRSFDELAHLSRRYEMYGQLQRTLKKVDMASMHHSLEVRVPLLDREVLELSLRIPPALHLGLRGRHNNKSAGTLERKALLVRELERYVPPATISPAKRGFSVPLGQWLRGPLYETARQTLLDSPLWPEGLFNRDAVEAMLEQHKSGKRDRKWTIWTLLALQWWAQHHLRPAPQPWVPPTNEKLAGTVPTTTSATTPAQ